MTGFVSITGAKQRQAVLPWVFAAVLAACIWMLFARVLAGMAADWWREPAWSQGMLLPPLACYLAYSQRRRTFRQPAAIDMRGVGAIGAACLMWLAGSLASEFFLMRMSFVLMLFGLAWTFWGAARVKTLSFPFLLLASMVPLPALVYNSLAAPLQLLASDWAVRAAQFFGISVFRDGNVIQLAGITLGVAEACSGLNSLSAMLVGSIIIGYLVCRGALNRAILVAIAAPLAILVNIFRVSGTAILAEYQPEFALGYYHSFSGWMVVMVGFGLLYAAARLLHVCIGAPEQFQ